jgi:hypothetical protein
MVRSVISSGPIAADAAAALAFWMNLRRLLSKRQVVVMVVPLG